MRYVVLFLSLLGGALCCGLTGGFSGLGWLWKLPVGIVGSFLFLVLVLFLILLISCAFVRTDKPQKKDSLYYRHMVYLLIDVALWLLRIRVHTNGMEKTPKSGRFLLVCNHINDLDPVMLLNSFPKSQLAFVSKRENSTMPFIGKLMHKLSCQLINRENDREALKTIINCIHLIQQDAVSIAVFPEGYTSKDGMLRSFRSGVFKIAQKTKVPIAVCTIQNTNRIFRNIKKLQPTHVELHLVEVLQPETFEAMSTVELGNRIHQLMAEDLGEALVLKENP